MDESHRHGRADRPSIVARVGATLRARRNDLDLTQAETADLAGVSVRFIRDLEAGKETAQLGLTLRVVDALGLRMLFARQHDVPTTVHEEQKMH